MDDFYIRRGLGATAAKRAEIPDAAPRALVAKAQIRYLRAVQARLSPRDAPPTDGGDDVVQPVRGSHRVTSRRVVALAVVDHGYSKA